MYFQQGRLFQTRKRESNQINAHNHLYSLPNSSNQSLNARLQLRGVGADDIVLESLSILVEEERRHGPNAQFGGKVRQGVDVELVELGLGVGFAELSNLGGDGLAGTAPGGEAIDYDELLGVDDLLLELSLGGESDNPSVRHGGRCLELRCRCN